ncbi:hypothetical protein [Marinicellulosiphila megalodicopiae]|uniref:hypothetical protein n=1 Tax=Marinicellulosiphila megalodicopiae TaxID=2724896 RepID=UPI003BB0D891
MNIFKRIGILTGTYLWATKVFAHAGEAEASAAEAKMALVIGGSGAVLSLVLLFVGIRSALRKFKSYKLQIALEEIDEKSISRLKTSLYNTLLLNGIFLVLLYFSVDYLFFSH